MNRFLLVLLTGLCCLWGVAAAQEQTLLGDLSEVDHGGFGGPVVKLGQVNGEFGVFTGGRGGWIINHRFVLGGGGYGLANGLDAEMQVPAAAAGTIDLGYGGVILEYIVDPNAVLHASVELLVGAGGINQAALDEQDAFFVWEPGVNAMVNVTRFFRFGAGVSYRSVHGAEYADIDSGDLSGATAVLTFKFGSF